MIEHKPIHKPTQIKQSDNQVSDQACDQAHIVRSFIIMPVPLLRALGCKAVQAVCQVQGHVCDIRRCKSTSDFSAGSAYDKGGSAASRSRLSARSSGTSATQQNANFLVGCSAHSALSLRASMPARASAASQPRPSAKSSGTSAVEKTACFWQPPSLPSTWPTAQCMALPSAAQISAMHVRPLAAAAHPGLRFR